jgi:hypothetical protein
MVKRDVAGDTGDDEDVVDETKFVCARWRSKGMGEGDRRVAMRVREGGGDGGGRPV